MTPTQFLPRAAGVLIPTARGQQYVRRAALLLAALLSGGSLLLPRVPLLALLAATAMLVLRPAAFLRPELGRIWILLIAVLAVSLVGSEGLYLQATIVRYANFLAGILLLLIYLDLPRSTFVSDMLPLMMVFAAQAILTPILALIVPEAFTTFEIDGGINYTIGYLFTYHDTVLTTIKRADGFFFEPGVLQIYLNLYLFAALFLIRRPFHIALALVSVLATQSTTGIIIAVMLTLAGTWNYLKSAGLHDRLILVILAPIVLAPLGLMAQANLDEKLVGAFKGSTEARQYDFQLGMRIVQENPIFGVGFDYDHYREVSGSLDNFDTEITQDAARERTSSNGVLLLMSMLGLPMFLVFMWGLARQRLLPHKFLIFALIFLGWIGEALVLTPFFLLFILSGFVQPKKGLSASRVPLGQARPGRA